MNPPVFLQTGFRTGGTWLWSRFRESAETVAFCEPLNEALESITQDAISGLTSMTSGLNHPTLDAPYFEEYRVFIDPEKAGVRDYRVEFGLQSYFAAPEEQPLDLTRYLSRLLEHAKERDRQPVLKFTRALGRAEWLRQMFPAAKQILLIRDPWLQFQSGWTLAQRRQNFTFLMIPLFVLSRARSGSLRSLCDEIGVPHVPFSAGITKCAETYTELAQQLSPKLLFGAFLGMFIASHFRSTPFADLVIDYDVFERDVLYRAEIERSIANLTGLHVDLANHEASRTSDGRAGAWLEEGGISDIVYSILEPDYATSVDFARRSLSGYIDTHHQPR